MSGPDEEHRDEGRRPETPAPAASAADTPGAGQVAGQPGGESAGSPDRPAHRPGCGCAQLLVAGVVAVLAGWIYLAYFFHPFGEVHAVVPQVRSSSVQLALDAARPSIAVRVVVRAGSWTGSSDTRMGVSLGMPAFSEPAGGSRTSSVPPFVDPVVRMRFIDAPPADSCTAPCELSLPSTVCGNGCVADATLLVEYVAPRELPGAAATLTGTISAALDASLPDGAAVELTPLPGVPGSSTWAEP